MNEEINKAFRVLINHINSKTSTKELLEMSKNIYNLNNLMIGELSYRKSIIEPIKK